MCGRLFSSLERLCPRVVEQLDFILAADEFRRGVFDDAGDVGAEGCYLWKCGCDAFNQDVEFTMRLLKTFIRLPGARHLLVVPSLKKGSQFLAVLLVRGLDDGRVSSGSLADCLNELTQDFQFCQDGIELPVLLLQRRIECIEFDWQSSQHIGLKGISRSFTGGCFAFDDFPEGAAIEIEPFSFKAIGKLEGRSAATPSCFTKPGNAAPASWVARSRSLLSSASAGVISLARRRAALSGGLSAVSFLSSSSGSLSS